MYNKNRSKRIKTEIDRSSTDQSIIYRINRKTTHNSLPKSTVPQPLLSRIYQQITTSVNYDLLTQSEIVAERMKLEQNIKKINKALNQIIDNNVNQKKDWSRVTSKAIITQQMGMKWEDLCKHEIQNQNLIYKLNEELNQNEYKLSNLTNANHNLFKIANLAHHEQMIKSLKQQINRMKKNKFLREKQIIKNQKVDDKILQSLQEQYIIITNKRDNLQTKLIVSETNLTDIISEIDHMKQKYEQAKMKINISEDELQSMGLGEQEVYTLQYDNLKKKMRLLKRRRERQQQQFKKKYYGVLLDFQSYYQRFAQIDNKIALVDMEINKSKDDVCDLIEKMTMKENKITRYSKTDQSQLDTRHMMTEIKTKPSQGTIRQQMINKSFLLKQNRLNLKNVQDSRLKRRWSKAQSHNITTIETQNQHGSFHHERYEPQLYENEDHNSIAEEYSEDFQI